MVLPCGPRNAGPVRAGGVAHPRSILWEEIKPLLSVPVEFQYHLFCANRGYSPGQVVEGYLINEFLAKYADPDPSSNDARDSVAMGKWLAAENACQEVNIRFSEYVPSSRWHVSGVLHYAASYIYELLGECPDLDAIVESGEFGPGATVLRSRRGSKLPNKLCAPHEVTRACLPYLQALGMFYPEIGKVLDRDGVTLVESSRYVTVPKNSETNRSIGVEPSWNMFFQKGIGACIRKKLRRVGVDLNDQTLNQDYAAIASKFGNLATLDLSAASDTISCALVRALLPPAWLDVLENTRTKSTVLPSGEIKQLQKFSAMGNGFTFELESLLFWALAKASIYCSGVKDRRHAIYGDDIIVPVDAVPLLSEVLAYCGFTLNKGKSFAAGPFRESCGKHFWQGRDITPFYLRRPLKTIADIALLHNNTWRWVHRNSDIISPDFRSALHGLIWTLRSSVKGYRKFLIPDGIGDGGFIGTFDEATPHIQSAPRGHEGYRVQLFEQKLDEASFHSNAGLLAWLWRTRNRSTRGWDDPPVITSVVSEKPDSKVPRYRSRKTTVVQWPGVNPFTLFP